MSIKPEAEQFIMPPGLFTPTLRNYDAVIFGGAYTWQSAFGNMTQRAAGAVTVQTVPRVMMNTLIIASMTTLASILIALPAAYAFSRFKFKGNFNLQFYILAQRMAPPIAVLVPLFTMLRLAGLANTYQGIVLLHLNLNLPLAVWSMKGFIDDIPRDIDESAQLDGCSTLGIIWRIILPLAKPGITAVAILCFLFSWNEFMLVSTLSGPQTQTFTVLLAGFITNISVDWGKLSAVLVMSFIPTAVLVLLLQQYLIRGLTFGAVRG